MSRQDLKNFDTIRMAGVVRESIVDGPGRALQYFARGALTAATAVIIRKHMILTEVMTVIYPRS